MKYDSYFTYCCTQYIHVQLYLLHFFCVSAVFFLLPSLLCSYSLFLLSSPLPFLPPQVQMVEGKLPYPKVKTEFELLSFIVGNDPPLPDRKRCSPQFYDFLSKW